jgi:integrase
MKLSDITAADVRRYAGELVEGSAEGGALAASRLFTARSACARLEEFTTPEPAEAIGEGTEVVGGLLRLLAAEGSVARVGWRSLSRRGHRSRPRVYRVTEAAAQPARTRARRAISPKTINNSLIPLRIALAHAVEDGLIARNPAASAPGARQRIKIAEDHREMDFLRLAEVPRYLEACSETYRPRAEILIATGLRISEALDLVWSDVDFDGSAILVMGARKRGRGSGETSGSTKGDRFRAVEFGPRQEAVLRDLRARQSEHGAVDSTARPIFSGASGAPLNRSDVSRDLHKAALRRAGLRDSLRLHDLRHTAAPSWLAAGLPLIYVQRQLGHASITTTGSSTGTSRRASCAARRGGRRRRSGMAASRRPKPSSASASDARRAPRARVEEVSSSPQDGPAKGARSTGRRGAARPPFRRPPTGSRQDLLLPFLYPVPGSPLPASAGPKQRARICVPF